MKASVKWIIYGTSLGLLAGTAFGQSTYGTKEHSATTKESSGYLSKTGRSERFFDAKSIIGAEVKNDQGQDLGDIKNVLFNPNTSETFAAIGVGHDRYALVPWQAMKITTTSSGKEEVALNTTKEALDSAPAVTGDHWQELNNRTFAESVYKHYNLQTPTRMGGVGSSELGGNSSGYNKK